VTSVLEKSVPIPASKDDNNIILPVPKADHLLPILVQPVNINFGHEYLYFTE
jgi:hypothetical protein